MNFLRGSLFWNFLILFILVSWVEAEGEGEAATSEGSVSDSTGVDTGATDEPGGDVQMGTPSTNDLDKEVDLELKDCQSPGPKTKEMELECKELAEGVKEVGTSSTVPPKSDKVTVTTGPPADKGQEVGKGRKREWKASLMQRIMDHWRKRQERPRHGGGWKRGGQGGPGRGRSAGGKKKAAEDQPEEESTTSSPTPEPDASPVDLVKKLTI